MPTNVRDPRSFITPDAFEIDASLLGLPLAKPGRRLVALLIDLVVIGVLTAVTSGLGVFIWASVGVFLLGTAIRMPPQRLGQVTSVLFRGSIGCLGVMILFVVSLVGLATMVSRNDAVTARVEEALVESGVEIAGTGALQGLEPAIRLNAAESAEEAEAAAQALLSVVSDFGIARDLDRDEMAELLAEFMGDAPAYTDDPQGFAREMVERSMGAAELEAPPADLPSQDREALEALDLAAVLERYRDGVESGLDPSTDSEMALLQRRLVEAVATDTLDRLQDAVAAEGRRRARAEENLAEARAEAEERGGFVALLRDIWDQAGSAVGLWSIYFTVTTTLFQGFTVGKRIMGVRVVRLDGEPFTWWTSFERAGGYVAGIATGLLGFAQVFWDPNRQCVHDKIVGTAVVVAGAARIEGAVESAWSDHAGGPA